MADEAYRELARRVLAAVLSYRMNIKSVDYTMKNYVRDGDDMHPSWIDLAKRIDLFMTESLAEDLFKQPTNKIQ
jgi:hypothetical protein